MSFLHPALLWFLFAASVPVVIHLLNRRRHKTIRWAAMQFLLKATRESRGKKRLRHILILACRALGIAALALAAARPFSSRLLGWGRANVDVVVLVLDRSASMEVKPGDGFESRRQAVLEKVRATLADLGTTRLVLIDSASGQPQDVPSPDVLPDLAATGASDTEADLPSLAVKAAEYLGSTTGRAEIWIASDLQATNWKARDDRWSSFQATLATLPQRPAVRVLGLTGTTAANTSLRLISSRRSGSDLLLDLEVSRGEDARGVVNLPLSLNLNGARTTENLTLSGQSLRFQKRIALPAGGATGHGWLSVPPDGNPRDNAAFFAYGPDHPVKTLVVAPEGEAAEYLLLAAAPPGFGNQSATRIDPAQATTLSVVDTASIVWAAPLPEGAAAETLRQFLGEGGQVLFLPPGGDNGTSFLDLKWSAPSNAETGKFYILKDWNHEDGPLRDGIDGTVLPAERLKAIRRQVPAGDAVALAKWDDGEAFLVRRVLDRGTAWFAGSLPDYTWSNLGDADVLLPLVQRVVAAGAERFDAAYVANVGGQASRLQPGETRTRLDDYGSPDPANAAFDAGVFKLGERLLALNRPAAEDAPEVIGRDGLDAALNGTGYTLFEEAGRSADDSMTRDLWQAFLVAVLLFLIAEAILCLPKRDRGANPGAPLPKPARDS